MYFCILTLLIAGRGGVGNNTEQIFVEHKERFVKRYRCLL